MPPATDLSPEQLKAEEARLAAAKAEAEKPIESKAVLDFTNRLLGIDVEDEDDKLKDDKKGKKPDKPAAAEKTDEEKQAEADAAAEAARKKPAKVKPVPVVPVDYEKLAAAAGEGAAKAIEASKTAELEKKKSETPAAPELSPAEKRKLEVLARMETLYPDRYKGHSEKYQQAQTELVKYADNWRKEHPGVEFDEEAPEHAEFYEAHDVDWDDEDYTEALADIKAEAAVKKAKAPADEATTKRLAELETKEKLRELAPAIEGEKIKAAKSFFATAGDEYAGIVGDDGRVDAEKIKALQEADPDKAAAIFQAADQSEAIGAEIFLLFNGLRRADVEKNPLHQYINNFALEMESKMIKQPADKQVDAEGRSFLPAEQYWKLKPEQRKSVWTFSATDLSRLNAGRIAKNTIANLQKEEERLAKFAEARGYKKDGSPQPLKKPVPKPEREIIESDDGKPKSPSSAVAPKLASGKGGKDDDAKNPLTAFEKRFLGQ